jgi:hypothetical protein
MTGIMHRPGASKHVCGAGKSACCARETLNLLRGKARKPGQDGLAIEVSDPPP